MWRPSSRTFIVPHARMAGKQRRQLTDLGDVYLNNQNVGARAVRECIFTVLPDWYIEAAKDQCHKTLAQGDGKPLPERIAAMVSAFRGVDVTEAMLAAKLGKKRGQWDAGDVAAMTVAYTSIQRKETTVADEFAADPVGLDELVDPATGEVVA